MCAHVGRSKNSQFHHPYAKADGRSVWRENRPLDKGNSAEFLGCHLEAFVISAQNQSILMFVFLDVFWRGRIASGGSHSRKDIFYNLHV